MTTLPLEVLQTIFQDVSRKALLQCQLTCKSWNKASAELLYADLNLTHENNWKLLKRTTSNNSSKAKMIKRVNLGNVFHEHDINGELDSFGLLDHLIAHCPNIVKIEAASIDSTFWTRLTYAAYHGQLLHLQRLPQLNLHTYVEGYIYTALAFRKTLTELFWCDKINGGIISHRIFQSLGARLKDFPKLKKLQIIRHSKLTLSNQLEMTIQACCPKLNSIDITLFPVQTLTGGAPISEITSTKPCFYIKHFTSTWKWSLENDYALKYIMMKFPSLESLRIIDTPIRVTNNIINYSQWDSFYSITNDVLIQFFYYMLSIPKVDAKLIFKETDLINYASELIKAIDCYDILVKLKFCTDQHFGRAKGLIKLLKQPNQINLINISFPLSENGLHMEFLKKAGSRIYRLNIKDTNILYLSQQDTSVIEQILCCCPNLKEFMISDNLNSVAQRHMFHEHHSLESLTIHIQNSWTSSLLLKSISQCAPKLKYLDLTTMCSISSLSPISVEMPYTFLDSLTLTGYSNRAIDDSWKVFIKLYTLSGEHVMFGDMMGIYPSSAQLYDNAKLERTLCLNITCKRISELEIVFFNIPFRLKYNVQ